METPLPLILENEEEELQNEEEELQNEKREIIIEEDAESSSCWSRYFPDGYFKELKEVLKLGAPMVKKSIFLKSDYIFKEK